MRRTTCTLMLTAFLLATIGSITSADDAPGLAIGTKIPAATLQDQHGQDFELRKIAGEGEVLAIVFHRSADW